MAKSKLGWNKHGKQHFREIGKNLKGNPHRFYLGSDEIKARANVIVLEEVWQIIVHHFKYPTQNSAFSFKVEFPHWDESTLKIATAVSKGERVVEIDLPFEGGAPLTYAHWFGDLQRAFPMVQLKSANPELLKDGIQIHREMGEEQIEEEMRRHKDELNFIKGLHLDRFKLNVYTGEKLHDALNAYKKSIENKKIDINGVITQTGKKQGERVARIIRYTSDIPLSNFNEVKIERIIHFWEQRPRKENGDPYSFSLCKHTIRLFKHFIIWLHKSSEFNWKKPVDLLFSRAEIIKDLETTYEVQTYSEEELGVLWEHASTFERKLLAISLNCGFSISEIGSLDWRDVEGDFIKGVRPKNKVFGRFKLWEITKKALGTPKSQGLVFTTEDGQSLIAPTKGNNICSKIPSAWYRLLNRVQKHHPNFKKLGFHHLRKTSANFIRALSDGETMAIFLRHGKPVKSDPLALVYSNNDYEKVYQAQDKLWEKLKDKFNNFEEVVLPRKLAPAQVRQIRKMRSAGFSSKKLAEQFNITQDHVRKICRKEDKQT